MAHIHAERLDAAAACFFKAAAFQPDHPVVLFTLGMTLRALGRGAAAAVALRAALALRPDDPDTLFQVAALLTELGRAEGALAPLRRLVGLQPAYPGAAFGLGNALMAMGEPEQAEDAYRLAAVLEPDQAAASNNLGAAILSQCRPDAATDHFRRAVRLEPSSPEHHKNLGTCLLTAENFDEGWREYEWRMRQAVWRWNRDFPGKPRWDGGSLAGRTILVHFEQGLGDSVQFARYFALLKAMGARTIFECQPRLTRILSTVPGIDTLVAHGDPLPDFDCHASLMSLPGLCRTTASSIPCAVPYLRAEPDRVASWRRRMEEDGGRDTFRVGIQWRAAGDDRSIGLAAFAGLARLPGVRLYSLQQVVGLDELERLGAGMGIVSWPDMETSEQSFVDTAAVMTSLDLIVACDSAVAHVAGALGLRVFMALPWLGDWRWMRLADRTPWYPATRLFRMERRNDWTGPMTSIATEIARLAGRPRPGAGHGR